MRLIVIIVSFLLLAAAAVSHAQTERDGAAWREQNDAWKYAYVTGLLDGVTTGADFTFPTLTSGSVVLHKPDKACLEKAQTTFEYNTSRYFFGLSLRDFVDGLDAFYKDPANTPIPVNKALRVWAMSRKKVPEAAALLEELRKEWSQPR
ncbi:hypothetical protein NNJEOMEG_00309 [Fundidesulfovibrio magnetotacticus]|uniref:SLH domain-containing protein n=1 Tax=Fundidesulfovibrio magnetotacticus TaxID=2730080 RepID=A0A6V8LLB0_9BACT|nr:hypothetical protein [Fundidesulfovibrio magnetotacticus]GFK92484.1 hypothetical protein NNJEOMEG_00309 [Fundidesulfovibrio magnetotacticus]